MSTMEQLTANFAGKTLKGALGGREYLVAPLTLIVPGVLNGSQGPLYYPQEELAKDPSVWNHTPIVVYHPVQNGEPVSAKDPEVLNSQAIGLVLKAKSNGKLTAEGWFDIESTKRVDNRILESLEAGKPIELSTGLFTENEPVVGNFNGRDYEFIARNYRPDHLAVLPDKVGACSIEDGCGVLVNKKRGGTPMALSETRREQLVDNIITNCDCWDDGDREVLNNFEDEKLKRIAKHVEQEANTLVVANAAREGFKGDNVTVTWNEAKSKFEYAVVDPKKEEPKKEEPKEAVVNESPKEKTDEQWLAEAPPRIQSAVRNAMAIEAKQKEDAIQSIKTNERNPFTDEQLQGKPLEELQALVKLAAPVENKANLVTAGAADYFGSNAPPPVLNDDDDDEDTLPLPVMNYGKKSA